MTALINNFQGQNSFVTELFDNEACSLLPLSLTNRMILLCRGYMASEYTLWGYLTYKADVYSFGIVARKKNMKFLPNEDFMCLVDWVRYVFFNLERSPK